MQYIGILSYEKLHKFIEHVFHRLNSSNAAVDTGVDASVNVFC